MHPSISLQTSAVKAVFSHPRPGQNELKQVIDRVIDMTNSQDYYRTMAVKLNIHEIKAQLSKYIEMVEAGETVVVCRRNIPVAEIRPVAKKDKRKPILGSAAGTFTIPPQFYEPMTRNELAQWEEVSGYDPLTAFAAKKKRRK